MKRITVPAVAAVVTLIVTIGLLSTRRTPHDTAHTAPRSLVAQDAGIDVEMALVQRNPVVVHHRASRSRINSSHPNQHVAATPARVRHLRRAPQPIIAVAKPSRPWHPRRPQRTGLTAPQTGAYGWAHSRAGYLVANCESGDRSAPDVNTRYNGDAHLYDRAYDGKWQMDSSFWATYGGLAYASNAAAASEVEQDSVAYKGFLNRGWQPWECASIMGVG